MKKIIILVVFSLAICGFVAAQSPLAELDKIKEIKLLESDREDVKRIFAGYKSKNNNLSDYREWFRTPIGEIEFSYSRGKCNGEDSEDFDVSEWKVSYVQIYLKNTLRLKDIENQITGFGAKLSTYQKEKMYVNDADTYVFHNKDLGIGLKVNKDIVQEIILIAPKRYYSLICDKKIAERLSTTGSFFTRPLKERRIPSGEASFAYVSDLILSQTEITSDCAPKDSVENGICADKIKVIDVLAVSNDSENDDALTFTYTVTGGKISGTGKKVVWDLSGVKPGIYKITAGADDGCGVCGKQVTKEVKITECPDCRVNAPF
jgi:hypothetical protein